MMHRILLLAIVDKSTKEETNAVFCTFIDWKQAYSRQCHTLGVRSFLKNGVRPAIVPLLISYFENREMQVKWHGKVSKPRQLPGGGAMGSTLGVWEFLSQTNNNSDSVPVNDRFNFVDDLTIIEVINLINIGMSSFNVKHQVPSDLPTHGQYINAENLKTQSYLKNINQWTEDQKIIISQSRTITMFLKFFREI